MLLLLILIGDGLHDDSYLPLAYSGMWSVVEDANAHAGSYRTSTVGALTFDFYGDGFAIYGTKNASGGDGEICIDGSCAVYSWNSGVTLNRALILSVQMPDVATHTVAITAIGEISIDAIYIAPVEPAPTATPEPEATPEPAPGWVVSDITGDGQETVFVYEITTGDQSIFMGVMALLMVTLSGFLLQIWRAGNG